MKTPDEQLAAYAAQLPAAPQAGGVYAPCLVVDKYVYVSGHLPYYPDGSTAKGCIGQDLTLAEGRAAAQQTGLAILATLKATLGSLNRIERVVKVLGMLRTTPDFGQHADVMNGCTELFKIIWGDEKGLGVRSSVGMGSLPRGVPVEVEAVFLLKD